MLFNGYDFSDNYVFDLLILINYIFNLKPDRYELLCKNFGCDFDIYIIFEPGNRC